MADTAPTDLILTGYDEQHVVTYLRLLDAEKDGADWQEVAKLVLQIDPVTEPARAKRAWETHLARALDERERYRYSCAAALHTDEAVMSCKLGSKLSIGRTWVR